MSRYGYKLIVQSRVHECRTLDELATKLAANIGRPNVRAYVCTSQTQQRTLDGAEQAALIKRTTELAA